MIKRVNFTGRKRIPRQNVQVKLNVGDPPTFDATIALDGTNMPPGSRVYLEAMCAGSSIVKRFAFGSVGAIEPDADRTLPDFDLDHTFFVLKVVDQSTRFGRLLGIAENIRPEGTGQPASGGNRGILPIVECDGLGQQLWDIDFGEHNVCLRVNKTVPGLKDRFSRDPLFYPVVYPVIVQQILNRAIEENVDPDEPSEKWPVLWLQFGRQFHPEKESPPSRADGDEECREWVEAVVDAFCREHSLAETFTAHIQEDSRADQ